MRIPLTTLFALGLSPALVAAMTMPTTFSSNDPPETEANDTPSSTVIETTTNNTPTSTFMETTAIDAPPSTVTDATANDASSSTVTETTANDASSSTVIETTANDASSSTVIETTANDASSSTVIETTANDTPTSTAIETTAQEVPSSTISETVTTNDAPSSTVSGGASEPSTVTVTVTAACACDATGTSTEDITNTSAGDIPATSTGDSTITATGDSSAIASATATGSLDITCEDDGETGAATSASGGAAATTMDGVVGSATATGDSAGQTGTAASGAATGETATGSPVIGADATSLTGTATASARGDSASGDTSSGGSATATGTGGTATGTSTATTTSAASASTGTSGPLVGDDGTAKCGDFQCKTGADWLVAALCALSKCNAMWPLAGVDITSGDIFNAEKATFKTYDLDLKEYTHEVSYVDATVNSGELKVSDNAPGSWLGGGFDRAIEQMGVSVADDGQGGKALTSKDRANSTDTYEQAGLWGLTHLAGQFSWREDVPEDDATWRSWLKKAEGSPVLIYTTDTPDASLTKQQYYTVNQLSGDDAVVIWDPYGEGDDAYETIDPAKLKSSTKYLYHLDWPHFFYSGN